LVFRFFSPVLIQTVQTIRRFLSLDHLFLCGYALKLDNIFVLHPFPSYAGTNIEDDPARGSAVCTDCGNVVETDMIVSEVTLREKNTSRIVGHSGHVRHESIGPFLCFDDF
jgi:hypothetical protein